jgi:peroxisomal 3,2-trans-enoyl-CoA isomerase
MIEQSCREAESLILAQKQGGLLEVVLNRPKRLNAFTPGMYRRLSDVLKAALEDQEVGVVLVRGEGRCFSSGNDLANFKDMPGDKELVRQALEVNRRLLEDLTLTIARFDKQLLAVCQGLVVGFTFTMLPFFDRVWATPETTFHTPFVKILQSPEFASSVIFPRQFGMPLAKQILIEGRKMTAP